MLTRRMFRGLAVLWGGRRRSGLLVLPLIISVITRGHRRIVGQVRIPASWQTWECGQRDVWVVIRVQTWGPVVPGCTTTNWEREPSQWSLCLPDQRRWMTRQVWRVQQTRQLWLTQQVWRARWIVYDSSVFADPAQYQDPAGSDSAHPWLPIFSCCTVTPCWRISGSSLWSFPPWGWHRSRAGMFWVQSPRSFRTPWEPSDRRTGWLGHQSRSPRDTVIPSPARKRRHLRRLHQGHQSSIVWGLLLPPRPREQWHRRRPFALAPAGEPATDPIPTAARSLASLLRLPQPDNVDGSQVGARLAEFAPHWRSLLSNCRATGIVEDGVGSAFQQRPQLTHQCNSFWTRNSCQDLQQAVDALLLKGAIDRVGVNSGVVVGIGVETSGVGVKVGVDIMEIAWSWNWSWSWNLRSWSWSWYSGDWPELELELELKLLELELSWYYGVDPNPGHRAVFAKWGEPRIDLFATFANRRLIKFVSYLALLSVCFRRRMLILYAGIVDVYTRFVASGDDRPVII